MEGKMVDFFVILSFSAFFGYFNSLQCNMIVFISMLKHDNSFL